MKYYRKQIKLKMKYNNYNYNNKILNNKKMNYNNTIIIV